MKNKYKNLSLAPFTYLTPSLNNIFLAIIVLLIPQLIMLFITKSYSSLINILMCIIASTFAEFLTNNIFQKKLYINLGFIVQGLLTGFFVPSTYPYISVFIVVFVVFSFIKYIFGSSINSWLNPIVIAIIILYFLGKEYFPQYLITLSSIESGNPTLHLFQNGTFKLINYDTAITSWLNNKVFSFLGIEIPDGYISLLWDNYSTIAAFRFNILTLLASLFLISLNFINALIPFLFLFVYGFLVRLFGLSFFDLPFATGDIFLALTTSGVLFSAFFVLDWFGTSPLSFIGKIFYGILAGVICFFICGIGTSPVGCIFTILCINILSPVIQLIETSFYKLIESKVQNKRG